MKKLSFAAILLAVYLTFLIPFTNNLRERPVAVKLGYLPDTKILKVMVGDQRYSVAEMAVVKVLFYFGTLVDKLQRNIVHKPEYPAMYRMLVTAAKLDPYNADTYYFAQAAFTWEVGRVREVNSMLDYGMKYRKWDYDLPFYAGFNSAYFLGDYDAAARYMKIAAEKSGNPLYTNLAARYFYEAGQSDLGIIFLDSMAKGTKDENLKRLYCIRQRALVAVQQLTEATNRYRLRYHHLPGQLHELVTAGIINVIPADPYGGSFYIDGDGKIRSTSKFVFGSNTQ